MAFLDPSKKPKPKVGSVNLCQILENALQTYVCVLEVS